MAQEVISPEHVDLIERVLDLSGSPEAILQSVVDLLYDEMPGWHWVGIYLLRGDELILGPYQGAPTDHTHIKVGVGVCGRAVTEGNNIVVDDVTTLDNYLSCSPSTRAEIVVLIRYRDKVVAQFDVDSDTAGNFTAQDEQFLEELAEIVAPYCHVLAEKAQ